MPWQMLKCFRAKMSGQEQRSEVCSDLCTSVLAELNASYKLYLTFHLFAYNKKSEIVQQNQALEHAVE